MIATIHSNDRTGLLAAALVAGGLTAAGYPSDPRRVGANGAQACGLARLSGSFDLLRPDPATRRPSCRDWRHGRKAT